MSLLERIRTMRSNRNEQMHLQHGWEAELVCPKCGTVAQPVFNGWTPNNRVGFGMTSVVYANVTCSGCHADLQKVAELKLIELFADISMPAKNKKAIWGYVLLTVAFLVCLGGKFWMRQPAFDWLYPVIFAVFTSSGIWFTRYVHSAQHKCECGNASCKFMGMLGRSYCLRCSTCGKLLRLRD